MLPTRRRSRRVELVARVAPPAALFLAPIALYHRVLTPGWAIGDADLLFYFLPYRSYLADAWRHGRWLPLWNSDIYLGAPFLANIQAAALYPPNIILAALPITAAIGWLVALHTGLAGVGMYLYALRSLRLRILGSLVAGLVYMLGTLMFSQVGHLNQHATLAWTPWLMLTTDRAAAKPTTQRLASVAAVVALVVLAGHTQQAYLTILLAGGVAAARVCAMAVRRREGGRAARASLLLAAAVAIGAGVAALQLIPTLELISHSSRSGGLTLADAGSFSLRYRGFLNGLLPDYTADHPAEVSASVGSAVLPLIGLAIFTRWRRPTVWIWALLGAVSVIVAFGPKARVYDMFYAVLPGFNFFRVPARVLLITAVSAAVLSGYGAMTAEQLVRVCKRSQWRKQALSAAGGAACLAAVPILAVCLAFLPPNGLRGALMVLPMPNVANLAFMTGLEAAAAAVLFVAICWHRGLLGVLPVIVLVDLTLLSSHAYALNPLPDTVAEASKSTALLAPHDLDERYLALIQPGTLAVRTGAIPAGLGEADRSRYAGLLQTGLSLAPNVSMIDGTLDADGYDGGVLPMHSYVSFRAPLLPAGSTNPADYTDRLLTDRAWDPGWLQAAGVTTVVTDGRNPNPPGTNVMTPADRAMGLVAWRINRPLLRARLDDGRPARVLVDTGERVVVSLPTGAAGTLVFSDTYYPGWVATVDGRPARIEEYAGYLRGVRIPLGAREVVFEYRPVWLAPAAVGSIAASLVTLLLAVFPMIRPAACGSSQ